VTSVELIDSRGCDTGFERFVAHSINWQTRVLPITDYGICSPRHIQECTYPERGVLAPKCQQVPILLQLVLLLDVLEYPLDDVALEPNAFLRRPKIEPPLSGEMPE